MKIIQIALLTSVLGVAFAQQEVTVSGVVQTEGELPEATRVGVHVINLEGVWGDEIATVTPEGGSFSVSVGEEVPAGVLTPFEGGVAGRIKLLAMYVHLRRYEDARRLCDEIGSDAVPIETDARRYALAAIDAS